MLCKSQRRLFFSFHEVNTANTRTPHSSVVETKELCAEYQLKQNSVLKMNSTSSAKPSSLFNNRALMAYVASAFWVLVDNVQFTM